MSGSSGGQPWEPASAAIGRHLTLTTTLLLRCTALLLLPATKARRAPLLSRGAARQAACWRAAAAVCLLLAQAGCAAARASDILRLCVAPLPAAALALDDTAGGCSANVPDACRCRLSMAPPQPWRMAAHAAVCRRLSARGACHALCMPNLHVLQRWGGPQCCPHTTVPCSNQEP